MCDGALRHMPKACNREVLEKCSYARSTVEWNWSSRESLLLLALCPSAVVLKLYRHTEPLRSFPSFCRTPFLPNITESENGLHLLDDLRWTPKTASSNPRGSIEPSFRTTAPVDLAFLPLRVRISHEKPQLKAQMQMINTMMTLITN